MRCFFYGTLMDADVAEVVLGRPLPDTAFRPARLPGYERRQVIGESYPALEPTPGGSVAGVLLSGLNARDMERTRFFEGEEYRIAACTVTLPSGRVRDAVLLLPALHLPLGERGWDLARWQEHHKPAFLDLTREWMAEFGRASFADLDRRWKACLAGQARAPVPSTRARRSPRR